VSPHVPGLAGDVRTPRVPGLQVLSVPNTAGGDAFMTAELFAGKKKLAPIPLMTLAMTTSLRP
jgi:hypothetical protein